MHTNHLKRRAGLVLAAVLVTAAALGADANSSASRRPVAHTVVIRGMGYEPAALEVGVGDTVIWVNRDPFPHTVTVKGGLDSGSIPAGGQWRYDARQPLKVEYTCTFHPTMHGSFTVH